MKLTKEQEIYLTRLLQIQEQDIMLCDELPEDLEEAVTDRHNIVEKFIMRLKSHEMSVNERVDTIAEWYPKQLEMCQRIRSYFESLNREQISP